MLPLLVLACLTGAPGDCAVTEAGTYPDEATCQAAGRAYLPAAGRSKQAWTCGDGAFWLAEVAPGVFVHRGAIAEPGPGNGGDTANIGFVIGDDAVAVIDAGGSDAVARALLAGIRARTDLPVKWLILTHMHPDHVLGAGVILETGAAGVAHPALQAGLAARYAHYHEAYARDIGPGWQAAERMPETSEAPVEIDLGDRVLDLRRHATGHTPNDLSVFDRATGTWFLGDLVFLGHMPSIDGSLTGWLDVLAAVADQPADRVVPGHGPVSAPWPEAAAPTSNYLTTLAEDTRAAIAEGTPMIDLVTRASEHPPAGWLLSKTFHPRNVTSAYRALEWE
ncbi:MAG: MBL fold metallo-hydrolase [Rhodobacteraceae bacterium]|nr:MBL fold metallo-hydrolase [Paracoccaceae bacterium]MAY44605.1 MBL fold metallo-hydrolase [Paracoccaceae bacterium]